MHTLFGSLVLVSFITAFYQVTPALLRICKYCEQPGTIMEKIANLRPALVSRAARCSYTTTLAFTWFTLYNRRSLYYNCQGLKFSGIHRTVPTR